MAITKTITNKRTGAKLRTQVGRVGGLTRAFKGGVGGKPNPMRQQQVSRIRSVSRQMNRTAGIRGGFGSSPRASAGFGDMMRAANAKRSAAGGSKG